MIVALESSCDETSVALFSPERGLLGEWTHSQIALHVRHGGVVPDLATREHLRHFGPLLAHAWRKITEEGRPERVVVTRGPGLAGCLAIGIATARALGVAWRVPVQGVNHLRAHAWSPFIAVHAGSTVGFETHLEALLPHLGLIVSGGNTLLFEIGRDRVIRRLGTTLDDAAGEALDKGAKLLGLGYPGGPQVERLANAADETAFEFPRSGRTVAGLDFSFSGLKTSLRYTLEKLNPAEVERTRANLCASYQAAVLDAVAIRLTMALDRGGYRSVGLSGGVANNARLRTAVRTIAEARSIPPLIVESKHAGDNASMMAFAGWMEGAAAADEGPEVSPSLDIAIP